MTNDEIQELATRIAKLVKATHPEIDRGGLVHRKYELNGVELLLYRTPIRRWAGVNRAYMASEETTEAFVNGFFVFKASRIGPVPFTCRHYVSRYSLQILDVLRGHMLLDDLADV